MNINAICIILFKGFQLHHFRNTLQSKGAGTIWYRTIPFFFQTFPFQTEFQSVRNG